MKKDFLERELNQEIKKFKKERTKLLREIKKIEKEISFFTAQKNFFAKCWKQKFFPQKKRHLVHKRKTLETVEKQLKENEFFNNFFGFNPQLAFEFERE